MLFIKLNCNSIEILKLELYEPFMKNILKSKINTDKKFHKSFVVNLVIKTIINIKIVAK